MHLSSRGPAQASALRVRGRSPLLLRSSIYTTVRVRGLYRLVWAMSTHLLCARPPPTHPPINGRGSVGNVLGRTQSQRGRSSPSKQGCLPHKAVRGHIRAQVVRDEVEVDKRQRMAKSRRDSPRLRQATSPAGYLNKTELGTVRLTPTRNDLCCCVLHPTVLQFSTCLNGKEHRRQVAPNADGEREVDASSGEEHAELGWRKARYRRDDHQKEGSRPRAESPKC